MRSVGCGLSLAPRCYQTQLWRWCHRSPLRGRTYRLDHRTHLPPLWPRTPANFLSAPAPASLCPTGHRCSEPEPSSQRTSKRLAPLGSAFTLWNLKASQHRPLVVSSPLGLVLSLPFLLPGALTCCSLAAVLFPPKDPCLLGCLLQVSPQSCCAGQASPGAPLAVLTSLCPSLSFQCSTAPV